MTQEKEIHFTGYEHQILSWKDLNTGECFTLLILQQLSEVSKDPRGTYITNERLSKILHCNPSTASGYISKLKQKGYIVKITRVGATGRYIKTRSINHRTKTYTTDEQVKGIMKYVNTLLDNNPHNKDEIEEVDDTYRDAFSNAIAYFKGSDNLKEYINDHVDTFNDIDILDDWLEDKGFK
ncbi:winged helix-turn-helix domain-containing protein [Lactobacillus johnsonii]|uniref:winged helix-turn-helix domain-containing protein n=1 Tax=Lactobacillus johnsonii TaxID=33959 RepID=UPI000E32DE2C|nr:winged helix-turn-helix domain-containing protein [Lactobacillus johnsonii]AXQ20298.1 winged helix-turn-helix domain-containing protein [Lactobacillus johnsonii]